MASRIPLLFLLAGVISSGFSETREDAKPIRLEVHTVIDLGQPIEQFRAVPVSLGTGKPQAVCALFGSDAEIDPYRKMFFFPKSTLRMILFDEDGRELWRRDLGPGVVPGVWFAPIFSFDLDGDGVDEIYHVNNTDPMHPMDHESYVIERVDPKSGEPVAQWPFPQPVPGQDTSRLYRHFLLGGYAGQVPVLVAANGTYEGMTLRAFNPDMSVRWEKVFNPVTDKGSAGSHMCAVVDIDGDGNDDVMWGERAIRLADGVQLFSADAGLWTGHSDIVQPVLDRKAGRWSLWTCRESSERLSPRLVAFDAEGNRLWKDVEAGHMDTGWAAHLHPGSEPTVFGIRMTGKARSADGEHRTGVEEFVYEAFSGRKLQPAFPYYTTIPVDLNGDGLHELVRGYFEGDGRVLDARGKVIGETHGHAAIVSKFTRFPGEQILSYSRDGKIRIYRDVNAVDSETAVARFRNPFYRNNQRLTGVGYNYFNLGGL